MKKIVLVTFIITIICSAFAFIKLKENMDYDNNKSEKNKLSNINEAINTNTQKLIELENEKNVLNEKNSEEIEILEVWKNMVVEIKKNI